MDYIFLAENLLEMLFQNIKMEGIDRDIYMAVNNLEVQDIADLLKDLLDGGLCLADARALALGMIIDEYPPNV